MFVGAMVSIIVVINLIITVIISITTHVSKDIRSEACIVLMCRLLWKFKSGSSESFGTEACCLWFACVLLFLLFGLGLSIDGFTLRGIPSIIYNPKPSTVCQPTCTDRS